MKKYFLLGVLLWTSALFYAQDFDHGNNDTYTPYKRFAIPVAKPSPLNLPIALPLANREKDIVTKSVHGANAGLHFPKGTPGVKTVRYDLFITDTTVNFTGKNRKSIAVNGKLPGPTLHFTVGDTALIYVHNYSKKPTSVHWHGVQLPSAMDGVSFLSQDPIPPQTVYIYKFPVTQTGTYWYHSHYMLQEQVGLYGALIFNKRTEPDIPTIPVVLSDWSDTSPEEINRMLHTGNDWFGIQKHSAQSYWEALKSGKLGVKFVNEWKRMEAMDISDVYYEKFLLNGAETKKLSDFKKGDRVRLRLINGASSTYFWLKYSGGEITVVANDGNDVEPVKVDRLLIAPSETYDLLVTIPEDMQYEFLATAEDRSGFTSLWLGSGMKMPAQKLGKLNYFEGMKMMNEMMTTGGEMKPMGMKMSLQKMDMNAVMYPESRMNHDGSGSDHHMEDEHEMKEHNMRDHGHMEMKGHDHMNMKGQEATMETENEQVTLNYDQLKAIKNTELPEGQWRTLEFELTGNMNRYVWSINQKTVGEEDKIRIKKGENLQIILKNNTMMRHPIHLHGHDFRLLNQYGERSPLKNVVDILPMETDTLEFHASEEGDWFFHCHILYHMMSGMGRIFHYENSADNPEIKAPKEAEKMLFMDEKKFFVSAENSFLSSGNIGNLNLENTRWGIQAEWKLGYTDTKGYEVETKFGRYFGKKQWIFPYIGVDWKYKKGIKGERNWFDQPFHHDNRLRARIGLQYTLPWLVVADVGVDHTGHALVEFSRRDIPLSRKLRGAFMFNSDREFRFGLQYLILKNVAISGSYDSDLKWGIGVGLRY